MTSCQTRDKNESKGDKSLDAIDSMMIKAFETFHIPGGAVGIVKEGKVVLTKGYGWRDHNNLPVTEDTLFAIGSCTKAFTAFVLGQMVDEGLISWDDPVIKHLPEFRLKDLYATHHLTIRDLLTHRSGLPRHDLLWYNAKLTRAALCSRLQYLESSADLREKFQYNNLMYALAGWLIEKVTAKSWEENVRLRIFLPLGMVHSNFSTDEMQKAFDFALPYTEREEKIKRANFRNISAVGPSGSINSSIKEMARWVELHLSAGEVDGKRLIGRDRIKEMHLIQMQMQNPFVFSSPEESPYLFGYGLGWMIGIHHGHYVVTHGGGIDGFSSNVLLLPNEKMGVVLLTNTDSHGLFTAYAAHAIVDSLLGKPVEDWMKKVNEKEKNLKALMRGKVEKLPVEKSGGARDLSDYVGDYENPGYGSIVLSLNEKRLIATYNDFIITLEHRCFDHFVGSCDFDPNLALSCSFLSNSSGEISEFHAPLEPSLPPVIFKRKAAGELKGEKYLSQFAGKFEAHGISVEIAFIKDRLIAKVTGQPDCELIAEKPFHFSIKGLSGYTTRFIPGNDGKIMELYFIQPNGTFALKSK